MLILVAGLGRSGTHLLGRLLGSHPQVSVDLERQPQFDLVTRMAVNRTERHRMPELVEVYRRRMKTCGSKHLADKSHPVLWISSELSKLIPAMKVVGIRREALPNISSMLKHPGVLSWFSRWRGYPVPNGFLGIGRSDIRRYWKLSVEERCALRWLSHQRRLDDLEADGVLVVSFEELVSDPSVQKKIWDYLQLDAPITYTQFDRAPLKKWRLHLSLRQQKKISGFIEEERTRRASS